MKPRLSKKRNWAMDIVDLLILIAVVSTLAVMILLSVKKMHSRGVRPAFGTSSFKQPDLSLYEFGRQTTTVNTPSRFPNQ